jgi:hypothetical protein
LCIVVFEDVLHGFCSQVLPSTKQQQMAMASLNRALLLLAAACLPITSAQQEFQPQTILTVEQLPARRQLGSISLPHGSPWCDGKPTYWLVGHQGDHESPWCLQVSNDTSLDFSNSYYNYSGSMWELSTVAVLDEKDALNDDGKRYIDRHDCEVMDVNQDNVPDVLCGVGADSGKGTYPK